MELRFRERVVVIVCYKFFIYVPTLHHISVLGISSNSCIAYSKTLYHNQLYLIHHRFHKLGNLERDLWRREGGCWSLKESSERERERERFRVYLFIFKYGLISSNFQPQPDYLLPMMNRVLPRTFGSDIHYLMGMAIPSYSNFFGVFILFYFILFFERTQFILLQ